MALIIVSARENQSIHPRTNKAQAALKALKDNLAQKSTDVQHGGMIWEVLYSNKFRPLDFTPNKEVCAAYEAGQPHVDFNAWKYKTSQQAWHLLPYRIDFERMEQLNRVSNQVRKIQISHASGDPRDLPAESTDDQQIRSPPTNTQTPWQRAGSSHGYMAYAGRDGSAITSTDSGRPPSP